MSKPALERLETERRLFVRGRTLALAQVRSTERLLNFRLLNLKQRTIDLLLYQQILGVLLQLSCGGICTHGRHSGCGSLNHFNASPASLVLMPCIQAMTTCAYKSLHMECDQGWTR